MNEQLSRVLWERNEKIMFIYADIWHRIKHRSIMTVRHGAVCTLKPDGLYSHRIFRFLFQCVVVGSFADKNTQIFIELGTLYIKKM